MSAEELLAGHLKQIRTVLEKESAPWGRMPKIIAVTKTAPVERILPLSNMGIRDVAENRVQVLQEKLPFLEGKFQFHMIGRLQTNKVKYIIREVCLIHSLDRPELAQEIDRQAGKNGLVMPVLLQVNVSGEEQKAGVSPEELPNFLTFCEALPNISVQGLMTILPLGAEDDRLFAWFTETRHCLERLRDVSRFPERLTELSMGMSNDYALAARAGATMVRVGRALFSA